uniref:VWFA domain-containing protein n=1 Tax=Plectus sambesii TaxID=2011161 RepID=A0A914X8Y0_9BILA
MSAKSDETLRKVSYAVLALGIVLGVAGIVMLIIGVSKKCTDGGSSTISTPGGCYPTGDQLNPFFVDASSSKVTWDPTMKDTSSPTFAAAQKALVTEISDAFNSTGSVQETRGGKYSKAATPTNRLVKVTVNMITNGTGKGVNYYATMIFVNDGTSNPLNVSSVQNMLNNAGIPSAASGNPTDQCHSVNLPPTLPPSGPTPSTLASSSITSSVPVDTSSIPTTLPTAATSPGCTPPPSTNNPPSGCSSDSLNPFAITAYSNSIPWDPTMSDPNSSAYQSAVKKLSDQITAAFSNSRANNFKRFLMMATNSATYTLQKLSISQIANPSATSANAPSTGINFYATLVFVGQPGPNQQDIQNQLSAAGIYATAYSSTTAGQCSAYPPPPYPTGPPPPNSSPRPPFTCDPTTSKTSVIFLVDTASPTEPGINSTIKQQLIASYLQSFMPSTTSDSWSGLQMGVAIYYGTTAYMPNNFMCNNGACWANTVNSIVVQSSNPSISAYDSHNVSSGLLFAINEFSQIFGNNDPYGTARLAVVVTDGYQYNGNGVDPAPGLATTLKNAGFKLTAIVATPSPSVQNSIKALVSVVWSDSFPLASITQLTDPTLLTYTAKWVCAALPITTPAPPVTTATTMTTTTLTTTYTLPQLTTASTPPPTTGPTTTPTLPLPYCPYYMDIVIIWRSATQNQTFQDVQKFITQLLLAPGTGSFAGAEQNTITDRLTRIALITYDTNRANLKFDLTQYQYMSDYSNAVGSLTWPNQASLTADLLSEAFKAAQEVLLNSARLYASRSVIVFSDDFSPDDYNDSIINYHLLKDELYASVFGIYIGQNLSDSFDYRNFTDQRIALPFSTGLNPTKPSAINLANELRNFVCTVSPPPQPPPTTPPTTTTQAPCTYPPPPTPSASAQPTKAPAGAWPDITILLDTSANLAPGSYALNDRGFEAVRMFLVNTLQQYRIDANHTRVSLVTFDGTANVVFTFNQNLNMASLMNAIGNQWEYGPAGTHTADRNLNAALQMVLSKVYNEPSGSGYNLNHINFLWAFVTGIPTDSGYAQTLYQLQSMGIRTQAIGLGALDQQFLSNFGFDSFDYASPFDPVSGIASPTSPLPHMLYQQTTVYITPPPTLAQVSADIVIVIEESTQLTPGNFINVKGFLTQFFTHLQFGPTGSSVALFSYNNRSLLGWTLNSGNDKAAVLDITSRLSYQNSNISTPNINA